MNTPLLVQLKKEHHAPNGEDGARMFQLLSQSGSKGKIQQVIDNHLTGEALEVELRELRYAQSFAAQNALMDAVRSGHNRIADKLLSADPLLDPDGANGLSLLCIAGCNASAANRMIKVLISHGANINHQAFDNNHGPYWTPFWNAIHDDDIAHAQRLLDHGASMELPSAHPEQTKGYSAVHLAASCGLWETIAWLQSTPGCPVVKDEEIKHQLRRRDDRVDPISYEGVWGADGVQVPLLHLTASGAFENKELARRFVDWLVDTGEDWNEIDHNGEAPWQVARRINSGMREIFDEKLAHYQAAELQEETPQSKGPARRARM